MSNETTNWPELAIGLYDRLTQRNAEIAYNFDQFQVHIPSSVTEDAPTARWQLDGSIRVSTRNSES